MFSLYKLKINYKKEKATKVKYVQYTDPTIRTLIFLVQKSQAV